MCKQIYKVSRQKFNLHWGKSDELASAFMDKYNQGKPLGSQLRAAHWELMKVILRTYSKQLTYHQAYAQELTPHESTLPLLHTNNTYLANELKCSERKVRYLRERLMTARFFTDYVYHGQNAQYELEINTSVLYLQLNNNGGNVVDWFIPAFQALRKVHGPAAAPAPEQGPEQRPEAAGGSTPDANFATYSNQLKEACTLNYILSGAPFAKATDSQSVKTKEAVSECGKAVEKPKKPVQKPQNKAAQKRNQNLEAGNTHSQAATGGGSTASGEVSPSTNSFVVPETAPQTLNAAIAHLPQGLRDRLRQMVSVLWLCAADVLYSEKYLEDAEIEAGKACLAEYFCYSSPQGWSAGSKELMRRMTLVKLWIERGERVGKQRFVPVPGSYFDVRKPFGFGRTKAWYKQDKQHQKEITDRVQLTKACQEYLRSKEPGAKYSTADVYRKWSQRLGKRGPELLDKFHKYIAHAANNSTGEAA